MTPEFSVKPFIIFPAIDLRNGQVVRLQMGDPLRQTTYSIDPAETARRWLDAGAEWLHVVNLDGAFGESDQANQRALADIIKECGGFTGKRAQAGACVQFGGGLRSLAAVEHALALGVTRVVLGTVVVEQPLLFEQALQRWGAGRIAAGLDAQDGLVRVRGWQEKSSLHAVDLACKLQSAGLEWLVYTDIARDGLEQGVNLEQTASLAQVSRLQVIASGGVSSLDDVDRVRQAGLAGVIVGRAIYSGAVDARALLGG
jgi:phosphoribosylformimino-5-aminoimidazole carboxamide ribotide isomerase